MATLGPVDDGPVSEDAAAGADPARELGFADGSDGGGSDADDSDGGGSGGGGSGGASAHGESPDDEDAAARGRRGRLAGLLILYTALRLGLIVALTAVLQLFMPLIVALAFAVVIQLPLSLLLFGGPRRKVTAELAAVSANREAERSRLRAALRGETLDG